MTKRKYTPKLRAEQQEQTRERIVEAAMALHEEIGPRNTTVSAVAERAGVQRLTVYRHFPDDGSLFLACTTHWLKMNPLPEPACWSGVEDPLARCATAFGTFYAYYGRTRRMWSAAYRDRDEVAALKPNMDKVEEYLNGVRDGLAGSWAPTVARAAIGHCLHFTTWLSLDNEGLADDDKVEAAEAWVRALSGEVR